MRDLSTLTLLRRAVKAKMQYWDAMYALEDRVTQGGLWKDKSDVAAQDAISDLAVALDTPNQVNRITKSELDAFIKHVKE